MSKTSNLARDDVVVRLNKVSKYYGDVVAVKDATLEIYNGEFVTLLGPSGSGKTTILMMIAGFTTPSEGEIEIRGEPVALKKPYERDVGMVFQSLALFPHMTVGDNIAFPLKMRRWDAKGVKSKVQQILEIVRLPGLQNRKINELSGGQQQRVALARALVFEPSVLLLDEALGALDRKLREEMQLEILRIQKELKVTTISVTHDQKEALVMSDKIAIINQGRLEQHAPTQEIYFAPKTRFVATFISQTNLFKATVTKSTLNGFIAQTEGGFSVASSSEEKPPNIGDNIDIGVKAEQIIISKGPLELENSYRSKIEKAVFEGDRIIYEVSLAGLERPIEVIKQCQSIEIPFQIGEEVFIGWPRGSTIIIKGS